MDQLGRNVADAVLGVDTLWGGDVKCASGTGRFIADSWFSDEALPAAYTIPAAARIRESGGVASKDVDRKAVEEYLRQIDIAGAIAGICAEGGKAKGLRGAYLVGLATSLEAMWKLAMETLGKGEAVSYVDCVKASTGRAPEPSKPERKRERVAELLRRAGYLKNGLEGVLKAVDEWRQERTVPMASVRRLSAAFIAHYDKLCETHLMPHLPKELAGVPRANIEFLPIKDAWFSGSMNYIGRARNADGKPRYEATYEINASLKISVPEFEQLISHEVVPGHVTNSAYYQALYRRGKVGFEATVLTMNTRHAALAEGIANNAVLMAHGVTEIDQLPGDDLQIGVLLALLQDDAKNQASYLTWHDGRPQAEVAEVLRREYLCTAERADKLSGAWGRHPLMGRMYLPAYRAGTDRVAELRRRFPPERVIPALYGVRGLVDVVTIGRVLGEGRGQ